MCVWWRGGSPDTKLVLRYRNEWHNNMTQCHRIWGTWPTPYVLARAFMLCTLKRHSVSKLLLCKCVFNVDKKFCNSRRNLNFVYKRLLIKNTRSYDFFDTTVTLHIFNIKKQKNKNRHLQIRSAECSPTACRLGRCVAGRGAEYSTASSRQGRVLLVSCVNFTDTPLLYL